MALPMTPIFTQTVGAGGASSITFNNIPQHFTDLKLVMSIRDSSAFNAVVNYIRFNGDSSNLYTYTRLQGNGGSAGSDRATSTNAAVSCVCNAATSTSNTFSSAELYIPNYTSSDFKAFTSDSVMEDNASIAYTYLLACLYRGTSAITSMTLFPNSLFAQYSTFSLYGIIRSGV